MCNRACVCRCRWTQIHGWGPPPEGSHEGACGGSSSHARVAARTRARARSCAEDPGTILSAAVALDYAARSGAKVFLDQALQDAGGNLEKKHYVFVRRADGKIWQDRVCGRIWGSKAAKRFFKLPHIQSWRVPAHAESTISPVTHQHLPFSTCDGPHVRALPMPRTPSPSFGTTWSRGPGRPSPAGPS